MADSDTTQQVTFTPATKQKNPKRVAAVKAIAERTRQARATQKKALVKAMADFDTIQQVDMKKVFAEVKSFFAYVRQNQAENPSAEPLFTTEELQRIDSLVASWEAESLSTPLISE